MNSPPSIGRTPASQAHLILAADVVGEIFKRVADRVAVATNHLEEEVAVAVVDEEWLPRPGIKMTKPRLLHHLEDEVVVKEMLQREERAAVEFVVLKEARSVVEAHRKEASEAAPYDASRANLQVKTTL